MLPETMAAALRSLKSANIPFLFFGMEALNMYSTNPAETFVTSDCDFLVSPELRKPADVIAALRTVRWPEDVEIAYKSPGGPGVLYNGRKWFSPRLDDRVTISIYTEGHYHMDIAFGDCGIPFEQMWRRSNRATFHGVEIRLASKEDIIRSKKMAGRDKDKGALDRMIPSLRKKPLHKKRGRR